MEIRLLDNQRIDKKAWDEHLLNSPGFELYMQSSYLDAAFPTWKALVAGNYEAVFPVFEKKLLFWKILRQPLYTGAFDIIGTQKAKQHLAEYLPAFFNQFHLLDLNIQKDITSFTDPYNTASRKFQRLIIPSEGFLPDKSLKKNINKAFKSGLETLQNVNAETFIEGLKENLLNDKKILSSKNLNQLSAIISHSIKYNGACIGIFDHESKLHAAQFFLKAENKIFFILCYSTPEGKKTSALHALQTMLIKQYLPSGGILHFGGSNINRIAEYNHNFGAEDISYTRILRKKIPFNFLSRK